MRDPSLRWERRLLRRGAQTIAGLDEVGRGAWAGPIVAAAVVLPLQRSNLAAALRGVRDSKQMTASQRDHWREQILAWAEVGLGEASPMEVDERGVIGATRLAMARALARLPRPADHLLIDYLRLPAVALPQTPLTFGDQLSLSIAAASVVAKVARDRAMVAVDLQYPGFGFARHKGYGTDEHFSALQSLGPSPIHRYSFVPVASRVFPGWAIPASRKQLPGPQLLDPSTP